MNSRECLVVKFTLQFLGILACWDSCKIFIFLFIPLTCKTWGGTSVLLRDAAGICMDCVGWVPPCCPGKLLENAAPVLPLLPCCCCCCSRFSCSAICCFINWSFRFVLVVIVAFFTSVCGLQTEKIKQKQLIIYVAGTLHSRFILG